MYLQPVRGTGGFPRECVAVTGVAWRMSEERKPPSKAAMLKAVAAWNAKHPIGTKVYYWSGVREGAGREGVTYTEAQILGGHTAGVYLEKCGFMALSHVAAMQVQS
jgi:hypothetical protein